MVAFKQAGKGLLLDGRGHNGVREKHGEGVQPYATVQGLGRLHESGKGGARKAQKAPQTYVSVSWLPIAQMQSYNQRSVGMAGHNHHLFSTIVILVIVQWSLNKWL